jgi:uncharacterized repeat protein (TIGR01451 family)
MVPGGNTTITLTVNVGPVAVPGVTNTATVSTAGDANAGNNSSSDPTTVFPADLSITLKGSPENVKVGHRINYSVTITNLGNSTATNVTVMDFLSDNVVFDRSRGGQANCDGDGPVICSISDIPPGASRAVGFFAIATSTGVAQNTLLVKDQYGITHELASYIVQTTNTVEPDKPLKDVAADNVSGLEVIQ